MNPDFWLERWQLNEIGFHQAQVNPYLQQFWSRLNLPKSSRVFVPLCGKTRDMLWLLAQGLQVVGVELSRIAIEDFFKENALIPETIKQGNFTVTQQEDLAILQGDFFALTQQDLLGVNAVFDRAALVALPPEMRQDYAMHLQKLLPGAAIFLIAFEYPQNEMAGPPFSVSEEEVRQLYQDQYQIEILSQQDVLQQYPPFQQRGLTYLHEKVYLLIPH